MGARRAGTMPIQFGRLNTTASPGLHLARTLREPDCGSLEMSSTSMLVRTFVLLAGWPLFLALFWLRRTEQCPPWANKVAERLGFADRPRAQMTVRPPRRLAT
jgi:hypothetical protein